MEVASPNSCVPLVNFRRDFLPHRGRLLLGLAQTSAFCGALSIFLVVPSIAGLSLAGWVWFAAREDLQKMQEGSIDIRGYRVTDDARKDARYALAVNLAPLLFWVTFFACMMR